MTVPPLHAVLGGLLASASPLDHVKDAPLFFDGSGALWRLGLTKQTIMFFLAGALTLLFFWSYARRAAQVRVPSRWGNFVEAVLGFIRDQMTRPFLGHHGDKYVPLLSSFFVYILLCNVLGLVPFFDPLGHGVNAQGEVFHGGNTATGSIYITAGLAICAFFTYHFIGILEQGSVWTYVKNLFPHVPIMVFPIIFVVEIVAHLVRPCALAIRLFANMLAGHTMLAVILGFTAVFTKGFLLAGGAISLVCLASITALTFLELLVAVIQAFVFTFLTTVFLAGAVHPEH